jgi:hypothetical protein
VKRRLFNLGAAISLIFCLAMAGLWISSLFHSPIDLYRNATPNVEVKSGSLIVHIDRSVHLGPRGLLSSPPLRRWHFAGFSYTDFPGFVEPVGVLHHFIVFSLALAWPLLLFALLPAAWLLVHARQRRLRRAWNLCRNCGYDVRATPEATGPLLPRCPECGAVVPPARI